MKPAAPSITKLGQLQRPKWKIGVPQSLVEINEKAYQPRIVSIGPYHNGLEHLKIIEEHKWRFLGSLLERKEDCDNIPPKLFPDYSLLGAGNKSVLFGDQHV
ncbi:hypothetical protein Patl1_35281 [Pistacia atlantica]|nr:hypothetical protein Patl1_35281 [Pistacia atlantica]